MKSFNIQLLQFIIVYPVIWLFSKLPFFILHRISDLTFFMIFYVFGYRKKIVLDNLKLSFPEKPEKEILEIRRHFFRHFTDIFIEMIKSFTISEKELNKRYKYKNPEVFDQIEKKGKSVIIMGSHYANWEWIVNLSSITNFKCMGVYKKLSNPYFDKVVKENRERFGGHFISTNQTVKKMVENRQSNTLSVYGLLSDQSPMLHRTQYWRDFLNVKVPIHTGAESLAKKYDFLILHMSVNRVKRSHYEVDLEILAENPKEFKDFEITDEFLNRTEKQINEKPAYYFWTHKRFKHKNSAPN
jgi:KDO2-lipid IV(A) lauroyltransferase